MGRDYCTGGCVGLQMFDLQTESHLCFTPFYELPDVQAGFRKRRGTRNRVANIVCFIEKVRDFQKNICFIDDTKTFDCVDHSKL